MIWFLLAALLMAVRIHFKYGDITREKKLSDLDKTHRSIKLKSSSNDYIKAA